MFLARLLVLVKMHHKTCTDLYHVGLQVTQLKFRLSEGSGECYYYLGELVHQMQHKSLTPGFTCAGVRPITLYSNMCWDTALLETVIELCPAQLCQAHLICCSKLMCRHARVWFALNPPGLFASHYRSNDQLTDMSSLSP